MKRQATYCIWGIVAAGSILFCALLFAPGQQSKAGQMRKTVELSVIDDNDSNALEQWAREFCRGWRVETLADEYGVDANMQAVTEAVAKGLAGAARQVVVEACEDELRKSESSDHSDKPE